MKRLPHHEEEYKVYLKWVSGKSSFLEIGARFGENLIRTAEVMRPNSLIVSVDLPNRENAHVPHIAEELRRTIEKIRAMGHEVFSIIGDSKDELVVSQVRFLAPQGKFDVVFIDGDHSYEGCKADYHNYGQLGREIIFHDILNPPVKSYGCWKVWDEIKKWNNVKCHFPIEEFIGEGSYMGIGKITIDSDT